MSRVERMGVVEAMRGIAAISVACFHFVSSLEGPFVDILAGYAWLGVDVFFVISGFVIPLSLHGRGAGGRDYRIRDFPGFLLRRLVRLEPPYLASIALTIVLWHASAASPLYAGHAPDYTWAQVGFHLFYLIPLTDYEWLGENYWTLAYEFVFYIVVGLSFSILAKRRSVFTFVFIALVAAGFYYLQTRFSFSTKLTARVVEFGIGVLLMRLVVDQGPRAAAENCLWLAACLAFVFLNVGPILGVPALASACAIFLLKDVKFGRWAFFIGGFSYSLYLTNAPIGGRIVNLGRRFVGEGDAYDVLLVALALAGSIAFAIVFAHFIEGPSKRAARRIG